MKYAQILAALQTRIEHQLYEPGTLMPSEAALTREFAASRNTVVRALRYLDRHGWVDPVRGRGRVVLGRPPSRLASLPRRLQVLLQPDRHGRAVGSGTVPARPPITAALSCDPGTPLAATRYVLGAADEPFAVLAWYTPAPFTPTPGAPLLEQLERSRGALAHRDLERLGARLPTDSERRLLALPRARSVVVAMLTVLDTQDHPLLTVDAALCRDVPPLTSAFDLA
ncbi:GntR family transcriptional regulator [Dactylosporangium sp. AC04546]|uniref:GntR family transcriptional regulator n=1 Tax=Dactylosporangium sp. AC04546 TaxID=2862460 RepID=UPI002714F5FA|nr:GntR family transcriptional regulator [Dactylosporangium sp. AC04546]WVK82814.1 GntR family transcriptional regulator [Dactylosporangium sp. AC04546]